MPKPTTMQAGTPRQASNGDYLNKRFLWIAMPGNPEVEVIGVAGFQTPLVTLRRVDNDDIKSFTLAEFEKRVEDGEFVPAGRNFTVTDEPTVKLVADTTRQAGTIPPKYSELYGADLAGLVGLTFDFRTRYSSGPAVMTVASVSLTMEKIRVHIAGGDIMKGRDTVGFPYFFRGLELFQILPIETTPAVVDTTPAGTEVVWEVNETTPETVTDERQALIDERVDADLAVPEPDTGHTYVWQEPEELAAPVKKQGKKAKVEVKTEALDYSDLGAIVEILRGLDDKIALLTEQRENLRGSARGIVEARRAEEDRLLAEMGIAG